MSDLLSTILHELKQATGATKALVGLVAAVVVAMIGIAAVVSNKPDFQPAFSGLSAAEMSGVTKSLSESGISFEVSQPPQPFVVFVDDGDRSDAMAAAYGSGALEKPIGGILAENGAASIFLGNEERQQAVRKREWQETEGMLETLDFVISARVRTSPGESRPLLGRPSAPTTASVTLQLAHHTEMDDDQADVVAKLVSRGLGVDPMNIVISDQAGTLYDGSSKDGADMMLGDHLTYKRAYDEETEARVNDALEAVLGPDKAFVLVDSLWNFDQSVTRTETASKGEKLSEETVETSQPIVANSSGATGGATGLSSNTAPGTIDAGGPADSSEPEAPVSTSTESNTTYVPSRTVSERVQNAPVLTRISVALFVDASVDDAQLDALERLVSSSVNFDELRKDVLTAERLPFISSKLVEGEEETADTEAAPTEEPSEPSPLMETLMSRGVEIISALVFLVFLMKSLKSAKKASDAANAAPLITVVAADGTISEIPADQEPEIDPELLARVQVEKLLESDPEKVGAILSSWARGEDAETGAAA